jgi:hypothetical protein
MCILSVHISTGVHVYSVCTHKYRCSCVFCLEHLYLCVQTEYTWTPVLMCTDRIYMNTCTYVYRQNTHEHLYLCVQTEYTWTPVLMCTDRIHMNICTYVYRQNTNEHMYLSVQKIYILFVHLSTGVHVYSVYT